MEPHPRELLEDDNRPVVDDAVGAVIDRLASPVEGAELAILGEEMRVLARHGSLARVRRVGDLVRARNAGDEAVPRDSFEYALLHACFRERGRQFGTGGDSSPGADDRGLRSRAPRYRRSSGATSSDYREPEKKAGGKTCSHL